MRYAIKRLQHSDLTFFEPYFRTSSGAKQKAINLDAAIFADNFFPRLSRTNPARPTKILFELTVIGPDAAPPFTLTRKALLQQKNWRLNGEMIDDKENDARFKGLAPGDVAVLAFDGDDEPNAVSMVVLSASSGAENAAHAAAAGMLGDASRNSMIAVESGALEAVFASLAADHPARLILPDSELEQTLEDAAAGNAAAVEKLARRAGTGRLLRTVTADDLERARERAAHVGALGEEAVSYFLENELAASRIKGFEHTSKTVNGAHPYDFVVIAIDETEIRLDVKSTTGPFSRSFHMSGAEVREAATSQVPYEIWRVYELADDGGAKMRRSADIRDFARTVSAVTLPVGVSSDAYTIEPSVMTWQNEVVLD